MAYDTQTNQAGSCAPAYPKETCGSSTYGLAGQPYRATSQDAIRDRLSEYRLAINQLEALSRALPNELPLPADEILRSLVLGY